MKKCKYILLSILIVLLISTISFADIDTSAYSYTADNTFSNLGSPVIGALQLIASLVSIATLAILGIRFMIASPEGKAQVKAEMTPYIIGAVMAFAMVPLLGILYNIFKD